MGGSFSDGVVNWLVGANKIPDTMRRLKIRIVNILDNNTKPSSCAEDHWVGGIRHTSRYWEYVFDWLILLIPSITPS